MKKNQKDEMLRGYWNGDLLAEEAALRRNLSLRSCYWKRASELRDAGLIEWVRVDDKPSGAIVTRVSTLGKPSGVSRITDEGRKRLALIEQEDRK